MKRHHVNRMSVNLFITKTAMLPVATRSLMERKADPDGRCVQRDCSWNLQAWVLDLPPPCVREGAVFEMS